MSTANELDVFSTHAGTLMQATQRRVKDKSRLTNTRLYKALSRLYVDLIEFCQRVRTLLAGTSKLLESHKT